MRRSSLSAWRGAWACRRDEPIGGAGFFCFRHPFAQLAQIVGWRSPLPVNSLVLGPYAKSTEPYIAQADLHSMVTRVWGGFFFCFFSQPNAAMFSS